MWVLLLVGCRAASPALSDAAIAGDGWIERRITDSALDLPTVADSGADRVDAASADGATDGATPSDGGAAGAGDAADARRDVIGADADAGVVCQVLSVDCPRRQACYPFPFEGPATGDARCGFVGAGGPSVPCQSQLECDDATFCSAPGEPESVCALRCDLSNPLCLEGTLCRPLFFYPGAGVCL